MYRKILKENQKKANSKAEYFFAVDISSFHTALPTLTISKINQFTCRKVKEFRVLGRS